MKYFENVSNGYKIRFEGARDLDEGENGEIHYILDCSTNFNKTKISLNQSSINCFPLFELTIVSQSSLSSSNAFDKLELKFTPSSSITIEDEYKLVVHAMNKNANAKELRSSMNLIIEVEHKEKGPRFVLSEYEFVVLLNSSLDKSENIFGKVHAIPDHPSQIVHYEIISNNQTNQIKINPSTGQLTFFGNKIRSKENDEIKFLVQASSISRRYSLKKLKSSITVKIYFRDLDRLKNVSYQFELVSSRNSLHRLNQSNSFLIDKDIEIEEDLLKLFLIPSYYPNDKYILSLENYLHTFSLRPCSASINQYVLKLNDYLTLKTIYLLNIRVKHKLSQQFLADLQIEMIVSDHLSTTTNENFIGNDIQRRTTITNFLRLTSTSFQLINRSSSFCIENQTYALYEFENDRQIASFKVVQSNSTEEKNLDLISKAISFLNQTEIIIDQCRMNFDQFDYLLNESFHYQLCSLSSMEQCFNVTFVDQINPMIIRSSINHHFQSLPLPIKPIEKIMLAISIIFIIAAMILILLICRLKGVRICSTIKNYLFNGKQYGLTNSQYFSSSSDRPPPPPTTTTATITTIPKKTTIQMPVCYLVHFFSNSYWKFTFIGKSSFNCYPTIPLIVISTD